MLAGLLHLQLTPRSLHPRVLRGQGALDAAARAPNCAQTSGALKPSPKGINLPEDQWQKLVHAAPAVGDLLASQ